MTRAVEWDEDRGRNVAVSRRTMERHLGRLLASDELVHHINGDPTDDRLENLQVVTAGEHARIHAEMRRASGIPRNRRPRAHVEPVLYRESIAADRLGLSVTQLRATAVLRGWRIVRFSPRSRSYFCRDIDCADLFEWLDCQLGRAS